MKSGGDVDPGADHHAVFYCDASQVEKRARVVNKHVLAERDVLSVVGMQRREQGGAY
jgi:hypothetical protein